MCDKVEVLVSYHGSNEFQTYILDINNLDKNKSINNVANDNLVTKTKANTDITRYISVDTASYTSIMHIIKYFNNKYNKHNKHNKHNKKNSKDDNINNNDNIPDIQWQTGANCYLGWFNIDISDKDSANSKYSFNVKEHGRSVKYFPNEITADVSQLTVLWYIRKKGKTLLNELNCEWINIQTPTNACDATITPKGGVIKPHKISSKGHVVNVKENADVNVNVNDNVNKDINTRKQEFYNSLIIYKSNYTESMIIDFYDYWSEHGEKDRKFRKEKEKSFNTELRLKNWNKRSKTYNNNNNKPKKEDAATILQRKYGLIK